jgi:hypothetical protein
MGQQPDRARRMAEAAGDPDMEVDVIDAWTGDTSALAAVQAAALGGPFDAETLAWAARLSARHGQAGEADRFRRLIYYFHEGAGRPGHEVRIVRSLADAGSGIPFTHPYGRTLYRRSTPGVLLAQGLPRLELVDLAHAN